MASPPDTSHLQSFGKFTLLRKLGSGGMADVFLAQVSGPRGFNRQVALKCLLPTLAPNDDRTDSFVSEAILGGYLSHHNIVQTLELGWEADRYFIAMEFVDGITLAQLLQHYVNSGRFMPLGLILDIARQICEGLAYAHVACDPQGQPLHMIHRDLKPANILLSVHGVVKITDFGVAKAASNLKQTTMSGALKGTPAYMSPEQAACEPVDLRSDLFSLGAILFKMLTLQSLYPDLKGLDGLTRVIEANYHGQLELLEAHPPVLANIVRRLLARERSQRYQSAVELKRELLAVRDTSGAEPLELSTVVGEVIAAWRAEAEALAAGFQSLDVALDLSETGGNATWVEEDHRTKLVFQEDMPGAYPNWSVDATFAQTGHQDERDAGPVRTEFLKLPARPDPGRAVQLNSPSLITGASLPREFALSPPPDSLVAGASLPKDFVLTALPESRGGGPSLPKDFAAAPAAEGGTADFAVAPAAEGGAADFAAAPAAEGGADFAAAPAAEGGTAAVLKNGAAAEPLLASDLPIAQTPASAPAPVTAAAVIEPAKAALPELPAARQVSAEARVSTETQVSVPTAAPGFRWGWLVLAAALAGGIAVLYRVL